MAIAIKLGKSGRSIGYVSLLGYFFILCTLVMVVATAIDTYREKEHAKWPSVVATITQQTVRKTNAGSRAEWYIESTLRYQVDGEDLTASTHSFGGSIWEEGSMRRWAAQHRPGTALPVRYDPQHHNKVVVFAGDMPETELKAPEDLKGLLVFLFLSVILVAIGRSLQARQLQASL